MRANGISNANKNDVMHRNCLPSGGNSMSRAAWHLLARAAPSRTEIPRDAMPIGSLKIESEMRRHTKVQERRHSHALPLHQGMASAAMTRNPKYPSYRRIFRLG
jgi:hypothetical protein